MDSLPPVILVNKQNCRIPIPLADILTTTPFSGLVQALNNKHWCLVSLRPVSVYQNVSGLLILDYTFCFL